MKKAIFALFILTTSLQVSAAVTAEQISQQIKQQGAAAVVDQLFDHPQDDHAAWIEILNQIATGDEQWLQVAAQLAPATKGYSQKTLTEMLAAAMTHNAKGVLALINDSTVAPKVLNVQNLCSLVKFVATEAEYDQVAVDTIRALYQAPTGKACLQQVIQTIGQSKRLPVENNQ